MAAIRSRRFGNRGVNIKCDPFSDYHKFVSTGAPNTLQRLFPNDSVAKIPECREGLTSIPMEILPEGKVPESLPARLHLRIRTRRSRRTQTR